MLFLRHVARVLLVVTISGCGSDDQLSKVSGSVSFAEAVVPQSTWRVVVTLVDYSMADGPSAEIGSFEQDSPTEIPIRYEIEYAPSRIDDRNLYSVRAQVFDVTNPESPILSFTSTQTYPVLTNGFGSEADVIVVAVD